jgi:hypothetical protein
MWTTSASSAQERGREVGAASAQRRGAAVFGRAHEALHYRHLSCLQHGQEALARKTAQPLDFGPGAPELRVRADHFTRVH